MTSLCRWVGAFGLSIALAQGMVACGDDSADKKDEETEDDGAGECEGGAESCAGHGWVTPATGASAEIDFKDAEAGAEFIVMPFATGDTATVEGATAETFDVTLEAVKAAGSGLKFAMARQNELALTDAAYDWQALDADRRHLANRFRRELGEAQTPGFWETARRIDRALTKGQNNLVADAGPGPVESGYRRALAVQRAAPARLTKTTAVTCPSAGDEVTVPTATLEPNDVAVKDGSDETDFCYVVVSDPVTESDAAAIKATVKEVLRRFKSASFYNDSFAPAGDVTFKPMIVIVDFSDENVWPSAEAQSGLQGAGFYLGQLVGDTGAPMLYMAADFSKVAGGPTAGDATSKPIWHGTIAHEMQHAAIDYYRGRQGKKPETGALDESIAHFFEDLFGYGSERFSFPTEFLSLFASGIQPFMHAADSAKAERGAGQALLYYLGSKKGGFEKDADGHITGGGGLQYIIDVVKNSTQAGTVNLAAKFGGEWVETMGNYLGALVLDGTAIEGVEQKYKVQDPIDGVKDLQGTATKKFGMHYNGFGGLADRLAEYEAVAASPKIEGISFYQTKPIKVTLGAAGEKLKVTWSAEQKGAAVSVVRIK
jgi:hypothetical protein